MLPVFGNAHSNILRHGYMFGEWSDWENYFHAGIDFTNNEYGDLKIGDPLFAVCKMQLKNDSSELYGSGNHQWWQAVEGPYTGCWIKYAHAKSFFWGDENLDIIVNRGDIIGECGNSGYSKSVHLHFEIKKEKPWQWRYLGNDLDSVEEMIKHYIDPLEFCSAYDIFYNEE